MIHGIDTDFLVAVEIREHRLKRKRLLDTLLAATFFHAGIRRLITNNGADYQVFGVFEIIGNR